MTENTIEELNNKLKKISVLAKKERKDDRNRLILGWVFIISSIILFYLSINTSSYFYLSVPLSIITFLYLWVLVPNTTPNTSVIKRWFFIESSYSNLDEYVKGFKKEDMNTPIFTYSYKEAQLHVEIEELSRINSK